MITKLHKLFLQQAIVTTDTRKITAGSIFFALKGDNFDGNKFAQQALDLGASYAVVDDIQLPASDKFILVPNVLKALQDLALYHRQYLGIPIIGITGSNGKTTTKELIREVLKQKYKVASTQGNLNNHIGVPLTILTMDKSVELGIVEMGASHPGDIKELCDIALPDYGIITNIGAAHLEGFGTFEGVVKTKNELYESVIAKKGTLFCNSENDVLRQLLVSKDVDVVYYGGKKTDFVSGHIDASTSFLKLEVSFGNQVKSIKTNLLGGYNFENVLAALCIGSYFKVDVDKMVAAIESYVPSNNRSQLLKTEYNTVWVDCYNANPSSMKAALTHFSQSDNADNLVVILGDMLELGAESVAKHTEVIDLLRELGIKNAYLVGSQFKMAGSFGSQFLKVDELNEFLKQQELQQKTILVKGSRGIQLEKTLPLL
jgi:UDP-N-acetylmuramoyl-tripeptide--D-alanyl-D-alanine ligase